MQSVVIMPVARRNLFITHTHAHTHTRTHTHTNRTQRTYTDPGKHAWGQAPLLGALVPFVPGDASMDPVKNPLKDPTAKK